MVSFLVIQFTFGGDFFLIRFGVLDGPVFTAVLAVLLLQILLGIMTVLYIAPWHLAIAHQFVAVVLWVLVLRARFLSLYPRAQSIREG